MYVCIRVVASDSQRRQSLSSIEVKKLQQADSVRRKSLTAVQTMGSDKAERRESRSERHKRVCTNIQTNYTCLYKVCAKPQCYVFNKKALMYLKEASSIVTFSEVLEQLNCKKKSLLIINT